MKKVSVQFNLEKDDVVTHKQLEGILREFARQIGYGITSIQINNTEKRGKR